MSISGILPAFAFLFSVVLVFALGRISSRIGLVDAPTSRKVHIGRVPLCGGVAMFLALLAAIAVRSGFGPHSLPPTLDTPWRNSWPFIAVLGCLVSIGVVDDLWDMGAGRKLILQVLSAVLLLGFGTAIHGTGVMSFGLSMPAFEWTVLPVTILFIVGATNAFNMMDGLDGLAGGIAAVTLIGIALAGTLVGRSLLVDDSLLLLAVVLGFLVFNLRRPGLPQAVVFMGDAGSMMLGCAVAGLIVELSTSDAAGEGPAMFPALLWLVAIPVIDTISLMIRRPLAGRSPMTADRAHLHHLLIDAGASPMHATAILIGVAVLLGGVGLSGIVLDVAAPLMLAGLAIPTLAHCAFVYACTHRRKDDVAPQSLVVSPEAAE